MSQSAKSRRKPNLRVKIISMGNSETGKVRIIGIQISIKRIIWNILLVFFLLKNFNTGVIWNF